MFRDGYESLDAVANRWDVDTSDSRSARQIITEAMSEWVAFCTADPTRYQLMFQRVIPDFVPSAEAYAASIASYQRFRRQFAAIGITDDSHLDLWTAIATGLVDQQVSNDPGGDRWIRLVGMAVDLFCDHVGIPRDEGDNE
jgi:hypothetical protein